ncbi:hypothetical protein [Anoxybacillus suryakundensis]|uniref:Lipoprotein n=1 Tax=Anoxybacillus suryakundensis TaxID=1325335 RepID=A0A0K6GJK2_9BACL|nr:hypothetical protein [Anoxybacillus suryakundensis]CUA78748.1 hypothetical protein Ga0061060_10155 [Anoxybacillus suryakundensis]
MKKRQLKAVFALFLLAGGILAGCGQQKTETTEKKEETKVEEKQEEQQSPETEQVEEVNVQAFIDAYKAIKAETEKAKEGQPVDWSLVEKTYVEQLQKPINELDGTFAQTIEAAIQGGKSGELNVHPARQIVDKVTQSYFYQLQKKLQKDVVAALEAGDQQKATALFDQIKLLATEIFVPTAMKRDEYYQLTGESSLEQSINAGLAAQEEALKANNVDDFKVYIQLTDKSIYRSYYLASKSYAEKIEAGVKEGKAEDELKGQQAEAWGFFQAIKGSLAEGDEAATARLDEILSLNNDYKTIKASEVSALYAKALFGKMKGYHEKAPAQLDENNVVEAKVKALEGNMFLKAIELDVQAKLGDEKAAELFATAEKWYNAIAENKKDEAAQYSKAVLDAVSAIVQ